VTSCKQAAVFRMVSNRLYFVRIHRIRFNHRDISTVDCSDLSCAAAIRPIGARERARMFSRPTNADRDRRCADLLQRAELVRTYGWEDYRAVWSAGEVAGVAPSSAITTYSAN
jgi:hypothetical protein